MLGDIAKGLRLVCDFIHQLESREATSLRQLRPSKTFHDFGDGGLLRAEFVRSVRDKSGSSVLDHFQSFDVDILVGVPYACAVLQFGTDVGEIDRPFLESGVVQLVVFLHDCLEFGKCSAVY